MEFGFRTVNDLYTVLNKVYGVAEKAANPVVASSLGFPMMGSDYAASPEFWFAKVDSSGLVYVSASVTGNPNVNITQVGGAATSMGQKVMASSWPVVLASDQSAVPSSQSGTWTVQQGTPPWSVSQSGTWNIGTVTTVTTLSQFPSAAALTDATANPSLTQIQDFLMGFNSNNTTWDRLREGVGFSATNIGITGILDVAIGGRSTDVGNFRMVDINPATVGNNDGTGNSAAAMWVAPYNLAFNGTTWDRLRTTTAFSGTTAGVGVTLANLTNSATGILPSLAVGYDPTANANAYRALQVTSGGVLLAAQSGAWSTGRTWTLGSATDSVSAVQSGSWTADVTDRAGRLLGVVYGSQGQQLLQRAVSFDLQVQLRTAGAEYDARQIRALTSADVVSAAQSGTWTVQQGTPPWSVSQSGVWNIGTVTTVTTLSQFPVAAALSDAFANPTTTQVGSMSMAFNGATWDRIRSTTAFSGSTAGVGVTLANFTNSATGILPTLIIGYDPTANANAYRALQTTSGGILLAAQSGTWTVGRTWTLGSGTDSISAVQSGSWTADVTDRAARLVGAVYGSQGQQLLQRAVSFDLQVQLRTAGTEYDARQIRALTSADVVSAVQSGIWTVQQGTPPWSVSQSGTWNIGTVTTLSQFPAAALLADATANPTLTQIQVFLTGFNGTTWDRLRTATDSADGIALIGKLFLGVGSYNLMFNGATWDRFLSASVGDARNGLGILATGGFGWNGATFDRLRTRDVTTAGQTTGVLLTAFSPPIEKTIQHNLAVTANTNILLAALSPTQATTLFRIMVAFDTVGQFKALITRSANTQTVIFNTAANLTVNALYMFDMLVDSGDTVQFQYSATAVLQHLIIQEIREATT